MKKMFSYKSKIKYLLVLPIATMVVVAALYYINGPTTQAGIEEYTDLAGPRDFFFQKQCPANLSGPIILPRSYPTKEVYAGFINDDDHRDFLKVLIELTKVKGMTLNILLPRGDFKDVTTLFEGQVNNKNYPHLHFIPVPSDESLWARDYMKFAFDVDQKQSYIIDLPYIGREGEDIPHALSLISEMPIINYPQIPKQEPSDADYGGNIMPITEKLLAVGMNMSKETKDYLAKNIKQEIVELDVGWLETGHVDEIVTILPKLNTKGDSCDISIGYASPELALEILRNDNQGHDVGELGGVVYLDIENEEEARTDYTDCFTIIQGKTLLEEHFPNFCKDYLNANRFYQKLIQENVTKLTNKLKETDNCESIETFPVPVLFSPARGTKNYGQESDEAMTSNPNMINNVYLDGLLLLPEQNYIPFHNYMEDYLDKTKQKHLFIRGRSLHILSGGPHCATNKLRYCL